MTLFPKLSNFRISLMRHRSIDGPITAHGRDRRRAGAFLRRHQSKTCARMIVLTAAAAIGSSGTRLGSLEISSGPRAGSSTMRP